MGRSSQKEKEVIPPRHQIRGAGAPHRLPHAHDRAFRIGIWRKGNVLGLNVHREERRGSWDCHAGIGKIALSLLGNTSNGLSSNSDTVSLL
jgi:hypothetical protein